MNHMIDEYDVEPGMYHIDVTPEDIRNGKRGNATCCPIALAMRRVIGCEVEVESRKFRIGHTIGYGPEQIENFIAAFDERGESAAIPFSFDLELDWRDEYS